MVAKRVDSLVVPLASQKVVQRVDLLDEQMAARMASKSVAM
jgi:hypothetical protein